MFFPVFLDNSSREYPVTKVQLFETSILSPRKGELMAARPAEGGGGEGWAHCREMVSLTGRGKESANLVGEDSLATHSATKPTVTQGSTSQMADSV